MLVPRLACIPQSAVDVLVRPRLQVFNLRINDRLRKPAHIPIQPLVHQFEGSDRNFRMVICRAHEKSLVCAPRWVGDEVRKGFVEGSGRAFNVLVEGEEGVNR